MSNKVTQLASAQLDGVAEVTVLLIRPTDIPAAVRTRGPPVIRIVWPLLPTHVTPQRFPDVAAQLTRLFAEAATELSRIKARKRPL